MTPYRDPAKLHTELAEERDARERKIVERVLVFGMSAVMLAMGLTFFADALGLRPERKPAPPAPSCVCTCAPGAGP
jgi:hypothetical protein